MQTPEQIAAMSHTKLFELSKQKVERYLQVVQEVLKVLQESSHVTSDTFEAQYNEVNEIYDFFVLVQEHSRFEDARKSSGHICQELEQTLNWLA